MKIHSFLTNAVFIGGSLFATDDWRPLFDDKPVNEAERKAILSALPNDPIVKPIEPRRILVFSATAGFRHRSIPVGKVALEEMGKQTGAYTALISDDPANFEPDALKQFDAIVLLSPTEDFFMPNKKDWGSFTDAQLKTLKERHDRLVGNLVNYIEGGGGLMGIHGATDACYKNSNYGDVIGGYFWDHPWTDKDKVTLLVEDAGHATIAPVFGDITEIELIEEIYQFKEEPYSREKLRVLLRLDPGRSVASRSENIHRKDNDFPVAWVQKVGNGRVFYTSIGHNNHIYWNPLMLKHYLAGIQFACGDLEADTTPSARVEMPHLH